MSQKARMNKMLEAIWQTSKCTKKVLFPVPPGSFPCPAYTVKGAGEWAWEKSKAKLCKRACPTTFRWSQNIVCFSAPDKCLPTVNPLLSLSAGPWTMLIWFYFVNFYFFVWCALGLHIHFYSKNHYDLNRTPGTYSTNKTQESKVLSITAFIIGEDGDKFAYHKSPEVKNKTPL